MIVHRLRFGSVAALATVLVLSACSSSDHPGSAGPTTGSATSSSSAGASSAAPPASDATAATSRTSTAATSSAPAQVGPAGGVAPKGFVPYSSSWVSASDGWALGTAPCSKPPCGSIVRTTDGGKNWKGVPAPVTTVTSRQNLPAGGAYILRFADRTDGWVAGRGVYATHNGGASWHKVAVGPSNGTVYSLETGGGYVYALVSGCPPNSDTNCSRNDAVYAAAVGSDSWKAVSSSIDVKQGASMLVVHGSTWFVPTRSGILHASGTSRPSSLPNPCPTDQDGTATPLVAAADAEHLDALCPSDGAAGSTAIQLYGSTDAGHVWRKAGDQYRMVPNYLTGMADNGHGVLLISTASGGSYILRSTDDGGSLAHAVVSAPTGGFPWADLGFTTTSQVAVTLPAHGLYLSHDAGQSWARVTI